MVSRMAISRKQFMASLAFAVDTASEALLFPSAAEPVEVRPAFSKRGGEQSEWFCIAPDASDAGSNLSGAWSKSSICFVVRYFGRRLPICGREMFLIGETATAPWRIRNL